MWKTVVIVLVGVCLAYFGYQEYRVGADASAEPVDVELADLEAGNPLPDTHIKIGRHHRLYLLSVIEYVEDLLAKTPSSVVAYPGDLG